MKLRFRGLIAVGLIFLPLASSVCRAELSIVDQWPAKGGTEVCADAPLRVTCNETPVLGAKGRVLVYRVSNQKLVEVIDLGAPGFTNSFGGRLMHYEPVRIEGNTVSISLHAHTLGYGEAYRVQIEPGVLKDMDGHEFKGLGADAQWQFKIKEAPARGRTNLVAAADGSGDCCTVQGAVDTVGDDNQFPIRIFLRNGTYDGMVYVAPGKDHIHLIGEDRKKAVVSGRNNDRFNPSRMGRALVSVEANDFLVENLTLHNTTPYKGSQAEALRVNGDKCVLRNCDFLSFQDTLLLSGRVYVTNCYIEGDVDFIWGQGTVFFEGCEIKAVHSGYYLQARNPLERLGYVFCDCKLTASPGVEKCLLARIDADRFPGSQAAFINCQMGPHVPPIGWEAKGTNYSGLRFQEFHSTDLDGKPLDLGKRHPASRELTVAEAAMLGDVAKVFSRQNAWDPRAPVNADAGR